MKVYLNESDGLYVTATVTSSGDLRIEGQNLSGTLGTEEIEYVVSVAAPDVRRLAEAIGVSPGTLLQELKARGTEIVRRGERQWLRYCGIPAELWSRYEY